MPRIASPHRSTRAVLIGLSSAQFTQLPQECSLVFMIDPPVRLHNGTLLASWVSWDTAPSPFWEMPLTWAQDLIRIAS